MLLVATSVARMCNPNTFELQNTKIQGKSIDFPCILLYSVRRYVQQPKVIISAFIHLLSLSQ